MSSASIVYSAVDSELSQNEEAVYEEAVFLMRCLSPISLGRVSVPCGRCISCRLNKQREWAVRIFHESKLYPESVFVTLTYDDKKGGVHTTLIKRDCQLFLKRLRKNLGRKFRYFLSGEYGEKGGRPHYHVILFDVKKEDEKIIDKSWQHGFVSVGSVSSASIDYVAKYTVKKVSGPSAEQYRSDGKLPEFMLCSRRPGLGLNYIKNHYNQIVDFDRVVYKSRQMQVPRFYVDKLLSEEDKEKRRLKRMSDSDRFLVEEGIKIGVKSRLELYKVEIHRRKEAVQADVNYRAKLALKKGKL